MNKLIFTRLRGKTAAAFMSGSRALQIEFEPETAAEETGAIYIGKVKNVVKNLNAAFIEYRPGVNGFYSLTENKKHYIVNRAGRNSSWENPPVDDSGASLSIKHGDEIIVQVARAAVKTKDAVLSSDFTLTGSLAVLTCKSGQLGISSKIKDKLWREGRKTEWEEKGYAAMPFGLVLRTNAHEAEPAVLWKEYEFLCHQMKELLENSAFRTCYSVLYYPDKFAIRTLRDMYRKDDWEILTDLPEIYDDLSALMKNPFMDSGTIRMYDDDRLSLSALFGLEAALNRAMGKTVWLKSGGYLVIEPTEAMTVIDVNTGKNMEKKSPEELYFKTNLEAAEEISYQLRLRNLSGIIIVDFIDMNGEEKQAELLSSFRRYLAMDPVKTVLIDMTSLGLVEITRKKVKRPLYEQIAQIKTE